MSEKGRIAWTGFIENSGLFCRLLAPKIRDRTLSSFCSCCSLFCFPFLRKLRWRTFGKKFDFWCFPNRPLRLTGNRLVLTKAWEICLLCSACNSCPWMPSLRDASLQCGLGMNYSFLKIKSQSHETQNYESQRVIGCWLFVYDDSNAPGHSGQTRFSWAGILLKKRDGQRIIW
jgi:hypothetical protein